MKKVIRTTTEAETTEELSIQLVKEVRSMSKFTTFMKGRSDNIGLFTQSKKSGNLKYVKLK